MAYLLTDGIYPEWAVFAKPFSAPSCQKTKHYNVLHSAARKEVERAFGVLQARWHIIDAPCRLWSPDAMLEIMRACIVLHNMIVVHENTHDGVDYVSPTEHQRATRAPVALVRHQDSRPPSLAHLICTEHRLRDAEIHSQLRRDLIEHMWAMKGTQE